MRVWATGLLFVILGLLPSGHNSAKADEDFVRQCEQLYEVSSEDKMPADGILFGIGNCLGYLHAAKDFIILQKSNDPSFAQAICFPKVLDTLELVSAFHEHVSLNPTVRTESDIVQVVYAFSKAFSCKLLPR